MTKAITHRAHGNAETQPLIRVWSRDLTPALWNTVKALHDLAFNVRSARGRHGADPRNGQQACQNWCVPHLGWWCWKSRARKRKQVAQRFSRTLSSLARRVNDVAWKLHLQGTSWAIIVVIAKKRSMYRLGRWLTSRSSRWAQLFQALYAVRCPDQQDRPSRWPPWSINMVSAGTVDMLLLHAGLVERRSGS